MRDYLGIAESINVLRPRLNVPTDSFFQFVVEITGMDDNAALLAIAMSVPRKFIPDATSVLSVSWIRVDLIHGNEQ